jgi:hypothetical protein
LNFKNKKNVDFKENPKLIYVEWLDAISWKDGWRNKGEIEEWGKSADWLVKQAGYLVDENNKYILLASKYNPQEYGENLYAEITKIPKGWIKKKKTISFSS